MHIIDIGGGHEVHQQNRTDGERAAYPEERDRDYEVNAPR